MEIIGKNSNGNSDIGNKKIMETWSKKINTTKGKLEKYTYAFFTGNNAGNTALYNNVAARRR